MPMLKKSGLSVKESHATSVLMMAALSLVSAYLYLSTGRLEIGKALALIPGGIDGGILTSLFYVKMKSKAFRRIVGGFVVFAAIKMLLGQAVK